MKHQVISNHRENFKEKKDTINAVEDCNHCDLWKIVNDTQ